VSAAVRVAIDQAALLGEGPVWHIEQQSLWYCDIPGRRLHRFHPASGASAHWDFHTDVGSFAPTGAGTFVVALRDGLWRFDPATDERSRLVAAPYDMSEQRFNDGKPDPAGRFWVGSIDEPRRPDRAGLWCYSNGVLEPRQRGITISNGLAWSPDARTMYWSDTAAHTVWAFDFDAASGAMSGRRVFARFPLKPEGDLSGYGGRPDGAAVDAEGCYWVAMYEGGRVLRLSPKGETLAEVRVPARCPTMPCFGGTDLKTVFVTSASLGRSADDAAEYSHPGCTFAFDVDVPGLPADFAAPV
jgi:sugar lactone lactonase YvrE